MIEIRTDIVISPSEYEEGLKKAREFHGHICPGMFNGVKISLLARQILGYDSFPNKDLIVITEIDRCLTDAIIAITGVRMGRRTLKFYDFGKFAATFCSLSEGRGVRIAQLEQGFAEIHKILESKKIDVHENKEAASQVFFEFPWQRQYSVGMVDIRFGENDLPGHFKVKVQCDACHEPVMDGKHLLLGGKPLCRPCASKMPGA